MDGIPKIGTQGGEIDNNRSAFADLKSQKSYPADRVIDRDRSSGNAVLYAIAHFSACLTYVSTDSCNLFLCPSREGI